MYCLPAGRQMAVSEICRVSLGPQPPSFRQELPATGAARAGDVRVHPADAWWGKQGLSHPAVKAVTSSLGPHCVCPDRPDLTQPGLLGLPWSWPRDVLWLVAHSLTLVLDSCSPCFLFSLLEKSGSGHRIIEWFHFGSDLLLPRHGWICP